MDTVIQESNRTPARRSKKDTFSLEGQTIRAFLKQKETEGCSHHTIEAYCRNLSGFCDFLGEGKWVTKDSLSRWRDSMLQEGYAAGTINSRISTVNSLYDWLGRRNWQIVAGIRAAPSEKQELSREEYLALLKEAKAREDIQLYLLVKVLACTDLTPSDMPLLTREAVNEGCITGKDRGTNGAVTLPKPLREELLEYARQRGIKSGPLFINGNRNCHNRAKVMKMVQQLAAQTGMKPGRANPRSLRQLHLRTQADFQKQANRWAAEQYARLLIQEETVIGWQIQPPEDLPGEAGSPQRSICNE